MADIVVAVVVSGFAGSVRRARLVVRTHDHAR